MKKLLLICLVVFAFSCASTNSIGQDSISSKAKKAVENGKESAAFGRYDEAIEYFEDAVRISPNYTTANLNLAKLYQNYSKDYSKAAAVYENVIAAYPELLNSRFNAANCYFLLNELGKAEEHIDVYIADAHATDKGMWMAKLLKSNIAFSREALANPVAFQPINLGPTVNSDKAEYFPAITADNEWIYFTVMEGSNRYADENIYTSKYEGEKWLEREKLGTSINTDYNEGAHSISPNGKYLLFTSNGKRGGNFGSTDIYMAKKVGNSWKDAINIGEIINSRYWESQPFFTADSKSLFFVSADRKDGLGDSDIYVSHLGEDGKFGTPINLGPTINTKGKEQRPFLHPDGTTLYFASTGHPGMGNGDIFMSKKDADGNWGTPINLGYPINTHGEELGIYVTTNGNVAYIASDRPEGFGKTDIYSFELPVAAQPEMVVYVKGRVTDAESGDAISCPIKIYDQSTGEVYTSLSSDPINGAFLVTLPVNQDYAYEAIAEGYLPHSESFSLEKISNESAFEIAVVLQPIQEGKEFVLNNIFFESGSYELKVTSESELLRLVKYMEQLPDLLLEIGGHTDDVGSDTANQTLSENRAKAVHDFLISKGVDASRLSYKGYGESKPLVANDSDANRAINRRTAFKVK